MTFSEHTAAVTSVIFSSSCKFVVSGSLDGTVRAFDLQRLGLGMGGCDLLKRWRLDEQCTVHSSQDQSL